MKKKLMVLGAGFPQVKLLQAARELGYRTVVASIEGDYPGFAAADEIAYVDISKPDQVLAAAREAHIDGIATCCLDTGIKALGYVCDEMKLTGLNAEAAERCNDKYTMKQAFARAGVFSARFMDVHDEKELDAAINALGYPAVLKALDLQGSNGVYICRDEAQLRRAFDSVCQLSRMSHFILEEYISGNELGAQAFVYKGEIVYILPHGDYTYMSKTAIPVGHFVPLAMSDALGHNVIAECEKAIRALGLDNCAVNIDLIERDGKVYVIELTGRAGATCLVELVSIYFGLDYYKMIAMTAMGEDPRDFFKAGDHLGVANASHMLISERTGTLTAIQGLEAFKDDPEIYDLSVIVKPGDHVEKYSKAKDRLGQVIVKGENYEDCKKKLDSVLEGVRFVVA